jgi:hypothetical protein
MGRGGDGEQKGEVNFLKLRLILFSLVTFHSSLWLGGLMKKGLRPIPQINQFLKRVDSEELRPYEEGIVLQV